MSDLLQFEFAASPKASEEIPGDARDFRGHCRHSGTTARGKTQRGDLMRVEAPVGEQVCFAQREF
jgi:hypothetical protein